MSVASRTFEETVYRFFTDTDEFVRKKAKYITIDDIKHYYYDVISENIKEMIGSSEGFTGFSELLIFRAIFHYLSQGLDINNWSLKKVSPYSHVFVLKIGNYNVILSRSIALKRIEGLKASPDIESKKPDIALLIKDEEKQHTRLIAVVSIKTCEISSEKMKDEIGTLRNLKKHFADDLVIALILLLKPSSKSLNILEKQDNDIRIVYPGGRYTLQQLFDELLNKIKGALTLL